MNTRWTVLGALVALMLAVGLLAGCGGDDDDASNGAQGGAITTIDIHALAERRDSDNTLQTIDVRTAEEVAEGTLPGALHIPHELIVAGTTEGIDLDRPVAVICRSGRRAAAAGDALAAAGAAEVLVVGGGGVGTWADAGYPTVTP